MTSDSAIPTTPLKQRQKQQPSRPPSGKRATPRVTPKIEYRDAATPSPSPSTPSDKGSDYHDANDGSPDVDELKPAISEDDMDSSPSPSKRRKTAGAAKGKRVASGTSKKRTPKKEGGGGAGRTGAWAADEDWMLFQRVYPRVTPRWEEVAREIGRDAKSCSNRLAVLNKRLPDAIKGISRSS